MDLKQLATFRHLARSLSFSRTADELNYAQSTVSAQIHALEKELGVPLFDRLGKRVILTPVGSQLLGYADRFDALEAEARACLSDTTTATGTVVLYAPSTLCIYRLPTILGAYKERFPQVQLNILTNGKENTHQQLRHGAIDLAFDLDEACNAADIVTETLTIEPLLFVAHPEHALAKQSSFALPDLCGQSLVLTEPTCNYRGLLETAAAAAGIKLENPMEFENVEAIKQCVKANIGISFLPEVAVTQELLDGILVRLPWQGKPMVFSTQMLWHKDKWLSPALKHLINVAREKAPFL